MASKQHTLFWGSSYDRGLQYLLFMWPEVIKEYPDAQLHIAYGWDLFDKAYRTNPERMRWKRSVDRMMGQKGITHHGRVGQEELSKIRAQCGIWAYPTDFTEINCITALQAQQDGLVPVTMDYAALSETVGGGVKITGDIKLMDVQEEYLRELLSVMGDKKKWKAESKYAKKFAKAYGWHKVAPKWVDEFTKEVDEPLVSVITVTKREGWWVVMARALRGQTYDNFEWIIVDDHSEDRSKLAEQCAEASGLNIRYIRGDKAKGIYKRKHGLVRANNLGWKAAKGELLVYLQDFVLPPPRGLEDIVRLYQNHPNDLIAPIDDFWHCGKPNTNDAQDWWSGTEEVLTTHSWRNVRNQFEGIRETDNPFDFEMDYAAIPKKVLDELNGFWEFFDDGAVGYDNTQIAYRALQAGHRIILDDTNVAKVVDLDPYIPRTKGDGNRTNYEKIRNWKPVRDPKQDK